MTWSIVVHDPATGALAVAVATRSLAVGASCPFVRSGVGAVSTQSMTNRYLAPAVLDALARGNSPEAAIAAALESDAGRDIRQIHAIDAQGRSAQWTGKSCIPWCGHVSAAGVSVAGNMLAGKSVIDATLAAYAAHKTLPLPERLLGALDAGDAAGGDRRGRQSAAMVVTTTEDFADLDLRVDDHAAPLPELRRLVSLWRSQWDARRSWMPTKAKPPGNTDLDAIEAAWRSQGSDFRFPRG